MINKKTAAKAVLALAFVVSAGLKAQVLPPPPGTPPGGACRLTGVRGRVCDILFTKTKLSKEKIAEIISHIPEDAGNGG